MKGGFQGWRGGVGLWVCGGGQGGAGDDATWSSPVRLGRCDTNFLSFWRLAAESRA